MTLRTTFVAALCAFLGAPVWALDLHPTRSSATDLEVTGRLAGVTPGDARFVAWSDLRALPTRVLEMDGEFVSGKQLVTALFLADLMKALPVKPGTDCFLATCADGYASVFTSAFMARYRPFLVLEINGKGPKDWPPKGLAFNPGPYVITVSTTLAPEFATYRDSEHKRPWSVTTLEAASYAERFKAIYSGRWARLSASAQDGREIWVNSCASCHQGPAEVFGGTKAGRPFQAIQAYAGYDRMFFDKYVRDPKSIMACAQMEPHPHYGDAELDGLAAFLTPERQPSSTQAPGGPPLRKIGPSGGNSKG
ncbi:MAG TPA: cytochrome c [Opitutaceae bacterium]